MPNEAPSSQDSEFAAAERAMASAAEAHLVTLLPREFTESGLALYDESVIDVVKDLRGQGIDADLAHASQDRSFIVEKSAELLIAFVVGVASTAAWDALKTFARARKSDRLSVKVIERISAKGTTWRRYTFDGSGEDVARAIEATRRSEDDA